MSLDDLYPQLTIDKLKADNTDLRATIQMLTAERNGAMDACAGLRETNKTLTQERDAAREALKEAYRIQTNMYGAEMQETFHTIHEAKIIRQGKVLIEAIAKLKR